MLIRREGGEDCDWITEPVKGLQIKVGDFGFSRFIPVPLVTMSNVGTERYWAPEVASGNSYSYPIDIYSIGIIAFFLIFDSLPTTEEGWYCFFVPIIYRTNNLGKILCAAFQFCLKFKANFKVISCLFLLYQLP